jgi:hypothetical protein
MGWNPLDDGFLTSTVLRLGPTPVAIWAMLMASADKDGNSKLTIYAAADLLRIKDSEAKRAFDLLASPDPASRNQNERGRRITQNPNGTWRLVSHAKYRQLASKANAVARQQAYIERKSNEIMQASWTSEACDDWNARFGNGTAPGGRIGKALKPLIEKHTWEVIRPAWKRYLEHKDPEFATPNDFAAKLTMWVKERRASTGDKKLDASRDAIVEWGKKRGVDPDAK